MRDGIAAEGDELIEVDGPVFLRCSHVGGQRHLEAPRRDAIQIFRREWFVHRSKQCACVGLLRSAGVKAADNRLQSGDRLASASEITNEAGRYEGLADFGSRRSDEVGAHAASSGRMTDVSRSISGN